MANRKILTDKEKFCLSAILLGESVDMAYLLSRSTQTKSQSQEIIHRMSLRWLRTPECQEYLNAKKATISSTMVSQVEEDLKPLRTKEDVLLELNRLATTETDSKKKTDILMRIADLERMKNESPQKSEKLVFYLPLRCERCEFKKLYDNNK